MFYERKILIVRREKKRTKRFVSCISNQQKRIEEKSHEFYCVLSLVHVSIESFQKTHTKLIFFQKLKKKNKMDACTHSIRIYCYSHSHKQADTQIKTQTQQAAVVVKLERFHSHTDTHSLIPETGSRADGNNTGNKLISTTNHAQLFFFLFRVHSHQEAAVVDTNTNV